MEEVLKRALIRQPEPIEWDEEAETPPKKDEDASAALAH
jgi:ATP-dependent Lon protease